MSDEGGVASIARSLRAEFDRAFATAPVAGASAGQESYLGIRVGGDPFALAVADLAGLWTDRKIVPLPGPNRTLLGIASFRGALAPIHDLRLVMGYPGGAVPRWLVLVRGGQEAARAGNTRGAGAASTLGLAFDAFDEHFRSLAPSASPAGGVSQTIAHVGAHVRGMVRGRDLPRPLIDVASVVAAVGRGAR